MKLFLRLFWLILTQRLRSRCDILGPSEMRLRVLPNDLDVFMHVNNGVFFTYADLGRIDLLLRANAFHRLRKAGFYPVVAAETMQFKKSLKLWQSFSIHTTVVGWGKKSVYLEQVFTRKGELVAKALIDARFLKRTGGYVTHDELRELLGVEGDTPALPGYLEQWVESNASSIE